MKLDKCLFCDGKAEMSICENEGVPEQEPIYFVRCCDCDAQGPGSKTPFKAAKWWNREMLHIAIVERAKDYG